MLLRDFNRLGMGRIHDATPGNQDGMYFLPYSIQVEMIKDIRSIRASEEDVVCRSYLYRIQRWKRKGKRSDQEVPQAWHEIDS